MELVVNMSAPTFIRSFKRFCGRRGLPALMISDNAKTFKSAANILEQVVTSEEVQKYFEGIGIVWKFNVPKAPWWGGLFERLVRSTKRCLKKTLGQSKFTYEELLTALTEIEMVLNSRPLTFISANDLEEPLTPSHLLVGRRLMNLPDHLVTRCVDDYEETNGDCLSARLKYLNRSLDSFWKRWRREYLVELREAHRHYRSNGEPEISEGDIVLVHSESHPRSQWKLGKVQKMLVGTDGQKRAAVVMVTNKGRKSTLTRPIQLLYPLEVASPIDTARQNEKSNVSSNENDETKNDSENSNGVTGSETDIATNDNEYSSNVSMRNANETSNDQETRAPIRARRAAATNARDLILAQALAENEQ